MKAVAFIRTSTDSQEVETQKNELITFIKKDGFAEKDIVVIGGSGASAIKEDEEYQEFKRQLYEEVGSGEVSCVYVWELSRLGRRKVTIDTIIEYLKEKKVNLKVFSPTLYLLNDDGSENSGMELAISMFTTLSEQEIRNKKERFRRGKARNTKEGKYNGGNAIPFGYKLDKDNFFVIDEEQSKVVLECFEKYSTGGYSTSSLGKEMRELGFEYINTGWLHRVLNHKMYLGGRYPRIISDELFAKVHEKLTQNFCGDLLKERDRHYFGSKLIVCPDCGRHLSPNHDLYRCTGYIRGRLDGVITCKSKMSISIAVMDGLLWGVAEWMESKKLEELSKEKVEELRAECKDLERKIKGVPKLIKRMEGMKEKATVRNIEGKLSDAKYDEIIAGYDKEIRELNDEVKRYGDTISFNKKKIDELGVEVDRMKKISDATDFLSETSEEEKQRIVHKWIVEVRVRQVSTKEEIVQIKTIMGYLRCVVNPWSKKCPYRTMSGKMILFRKYYRGTFDIENDDKMFERLNDELIGDGGADGFYRLTEGIYEFFDGLSSE